MGLVYGWVHPAFIFRHKLYGNAFSQTFSQDSTISCIKFWKRNKREVTVIKPREVSKRNREFPTHKFSFPFFHFCLKRNNERRSFHRQSLDNVIIKQNLWTKQSDVNEGLLTIKDSMVILHKIPGQFSPADHRQLTECLVQCLCTEQTRTPRPSNPLSFC